MHLSQFAYVMALFCFVVAAYIDFPVMRGPDRKERNYGNFCISMGFCWLTLGLIFMGD